MNVPCFVFFGVSGGFAVDSGRRRLRRVWGGVVRVGAAPDLAHGFLLQSSAARPRQGEPAGAIGVVRLGRFRDISPFCCVVCVRRVLQSGTGLAGHGFSSRGYFFDNPRRYDSDDDLAWSVMPQNIQAR